jgi:DNA-binding cell septation regulator SpoVG
MKVKVGDIKNVPWNKTKATFSIVLETIAGRFVIKDCRIVEGVNGLYVAGPSKQYNNKEGEATYFQFLDLDPKAQSACLAEIQKEYDHTMDDYKFYGEPTYNKNKEDGEKIPF